jgi:hypothetical protein
VKRWRGRQARRCEAAASFVLIEFALGNISIKGLSFVGSSFGPVVAGDEEGEIEKEMFREFSSSARRAHDWRALEGLHSLIVNTSIPLFL